MTAIHAPCRFFARPQLLTCLEPLPNSPYFQDCCGIECNHPIGQMVAETLEQREPEFQPVTQERLVQAQRKLRQESFGSTLRSSSW
jgi:hypothetical protein